jgi:hypothetical protein
MRWNYEIDWKDGNITMIERQRNDQELWPRFDNAQRSSKTVVINPHAQADLHAAFAALQHPDDE